jgi:hypothetical protein
MSRLLRIALAALLLALGAHLAHAEDNPLIGKWIVKPEGNQGGLITEFTATTMSFTALAPGGQPQGPKKTAQVKSYRKLTASWQVELATGTSFVAQFIDPNTMQLYVPGTANTARYVRMNP